MVSGSCYLPVAKVPLSSFMSGVFVAGISVPPCDPAGGRNSALCAMGTWSPMWVFQVPICLPPAFVNSEVLSGWSLVETARI